MKAAEICEGENFSQLISTQARRHWLKAPILYGTKSFSLLVVGSSICDQSIFNTKIVFCGLVTAYVLLAHQQFSHYLLKTNNWKEWFWRLLSFLLDCLLSNCYARISGSRSIPITLDIVFFKLLEKSYWFYLSAHPFSQGAELDRVC